MLHFQSDFTRILVERVGDGRLDPILNVSDQASAAAAFKDEVLACSDDYELREIGSNLVMPFVSFLAYKLHDVTPLMISGVRREHIDQHVAAARRNLYRDVSKRYFNDLMECKLEDLAVATGLDPRYKSFKFKFVEKWNRGNFTPSVGQKWLRDAFYSDWSGDKTNAAEQRSAPTVHTSEVVEMEIFLDCCGNTGKVEIKFKHKPFNVS
ncbi:hypothetical protein CYMTET_24588 [Cymbomonas tetramitiformis]|uniref:Uncharacterized protein n=1 Tax=Cymbomonas tetramitiformis TaxID=36881 RepID=A0AAE0FVF8_9CHLO|nr:hypothetical protein CYMTET_24588 [Cymbomonas tetramitiformis]